MLTQLIFDLSFSHYFYLDASEFYVGTGPGMPGCSYAGVPFVYQNHDIWKLLESVRCMFHFQGMCTDGYHVWQSRVEMEHYSIA